jgi:transcriptional regulator with XRE-family HTH domain
MAVNFESAREAGTAEGYSVYEAIGISVQAGLFARRLRVKDLAEALGISPSVTSKKLRGDVAWSMLDLYAAAQLLHVEPTDLLPRRKAEDPGQLPLAGISGFVAGTGFEPVTSGL